jgi:hypothetical protein
MDITKHLIADVQREAHYEGVWTAMAEECGRQALSERDEDMAEFYAREAAKRAGFALAARARLEVALERLTAEIARLRGGHVAAA